MGIRAIELQKGKPAIDVGDKEKLPEVIDILISAVEKGELDEFLISPPKTETKGKTPANSKLAKS